MFSAIYRRRTGVEGRREEMYALFAKTPEEVTGDDLAAIKAAVEADNIEDPAGKGYREASTALSLLLFLGDERFQGALSEVFPDRGDTAGAILAIREFADETKGKPEKGKEKQLYDRAMTMAEELAAWPMMQRMVKQYAINALLKVRSFDTVREMLRELCKEREEMDGETRKVVAELCNELSEV